MGVKVMVIDDRSNVPQITSIQNINNVSLQSIIPFLSNLTKDDLLTYFIDKPDDITIIRERKKWCNVVYWEYKIIFNDIHEDILTQLVSNFNDMKQLYTELHGTILFKMADIYTTIPEYTW